jgi:hypothetical protein
VKDEIAPNRSRYLFKADRASERRIQRLHQLVTQHGPKVIGLDEETQANGNDTDDCDETEHKAAEHRA